LISPFVSALLNPAPNADGASLHQPSATLRSKRFCSLSLREDGNIPKPSRKLSGYPPNRSFPAKQGAARRRGSWAKIVAHHDSHHNLLPSVLGCLSHFLGLGRDTLTQNPPGWGFKTPKKWEITDCNSGSEEQSQLTELALLGRWEERGLLCFLLGQ